MNQSKKRFLLSALFLFFILLVATGLYFTFIKHESSGATAEEVKEALTAAPEKNNRIKDSAAGKSVPKAVKKIFKTNEEIHREYGRLEVVYLFSGKRYEGAVISIDNYYTIVTVDGLIKIPMNEVKIRDIIK